jgi:hypothetical protein
MAITTQIVSVGTAGATLALPTVDAQAIWIENLEPSNNVGDFSRAGYSYGVNQYFTIGNNGTALFSFTTGETGAQFDYWQFDSSGSDMFAELIEGGTVTATATAVPGHNLNRNFSDSYEAELFTASAITGGTVIMAEFVPASNQSGGGVQSNKIVTLEPNTQYGFRFKDVGGQGLKAFAQINWVEKYNGYNDIWLNGTAGSAIRLRGGEKIQLQLQQGEGITADAIRDGIQVAVMRQD